MEPSSDDRSTSASRRSTTSTEEAGKSGDPSDRLDGSNLYSTLLDSPSYSVAGRSNRTDSNIKTERNSEFADQTTTGSKDKTTWFRRYAHSKKNARNNSGEESVSTCLHRENSAGSSVFGDTTYNSGGRFSNEAPSVIGNHIDGASDRAGRPGRTTEEVAGPVAGGTTTTPTLMVCFLF